MKLRVWHGCHIVAEMEFFDDGTYVLSTSPDGDLIGDADHVAIDPWAKLAGERIGNVTNQPVDFSIRQTAGKAVAFFKKLQEEKEGK